MIEVSFLFYGFFFWSFTSLCFYPRNEKEKLSKPGREQKMCEMTGIPMPAKISCLNLLSLQDLP